MNVDDYIKSIESEKVLEGRTAIYLAGPIDLARVEPDARHDALASVLETAYPAESRPTIYCPFCVQSAYQSAPMVAVSRNCAALETVDAVIAVWDGPVAQPSFGVPVEVFAYASSRADMTVVVGGMGPGLIADALRARGVREVLSLDIAVRLLRL